MKRLVYLLPTPRTHEGIRIKVSGQQQALSKLFHVTLIELPHAYWLITRILYTCWYECRCFIFSLTHSIIYARYNPKSLFSNLFLVVFSYIKPVYIEHNTIMETELSYLKRPQELFLHLLTLRWFRLGHCLHIAVNNELKRHLEAKGLTRVIYAQNGYLSPDISHLSPYSFIIDQFTHFKERFTSCGLFCGNGYDWHGLPDILAHLKQFPDIGLVIVGPYDIIDSSQVIQFHSLPSSALIPLIEQCDFGISTFRWDMIHITEGSPLKSRQYLCHGCPIITNYYDCAADFSELSPFIIDFRVHGIDSFKHVQTIDASSLSSLSQPLLSWDRYFQHVGLL